MSPLDVFMLGMMAGAGLVAALLWCVKTLIERHHEEVLKPELERQLAKKATLQAQLDALREADAAEAEQRYDAAIAALNRVPVEDVPLAEHQLIAVDLDAGERGARLVEDELAP